MGPYGEDGMTSRVTWVALPVAAVLASLSCGGGGGGGDPVALLNGTYSLVGASGENDPTPDVRCSWGTITSDGTGAMGTAIWHNLNGNLEGPQVETGTPYLIEGNRALTIVDPMDPANGRLRGRRYQSRFNIKSALHKGTARS